MKVKHYVGAEGDCIVINSPRDLYPLLDWLQSEMLELAENEYVNTDEQKVYEGVADYISDLMDKVEGDNYGNFADIEKIEY